MGEEVSCGLCSGISKIGCDEREKKGAERCGRWVFMFIAASMDAKGGDRAAC